MTTKYKVYQHYIQFLDHVLSVQDLSKVSVTGRNGVCIYETVFYPFLEELEGEAPSPP